VLAALGKKKLLRGKKGPRLSKDLEEPVGREKTSSSGGGVGKGNRPLLKREEEKSRGAL